MSGAVARQRCPARLADRLPRDQPVGHPEHQPVGALRDDPQPQHLGAQPLHPQAAFGQARSSRTSARPAREPAT